MLKTIKRYHQLIKEAVTFKDKFAIYVYLSWFPIRVLYKLKKHDFRHSLIYNITLKNEDGIFFCGNNIFSVWTASSTYEKEMRKYFNLKKGVFVDIGANIGKYTVILGKKLNNNGKVIAIEPLPANFEILKKNIKLNKLNNVISKDLACFSSKGLLDFYLDGEGVGGGAHSLIKNFKKGKISVRTEVLDDILKELKIDKVDLLKIDVEGVEADVLKGTIKTLKKSHPKIIFEAMDEEYFKKVEEVLKPFNYKIKKIDEENYFAY